MSENKDNIDNDNDNNNKEDSNENRPKDTRPIRYETDGSLINENIGPVAKVIEDLGPLSDHRTDVSEIIRDRTPQELAEWVQERKTFRPNIKYIKLHPTIYDKLKTYGKFGQSFNDVVADLIEFREKNSKKETV